MWWVVIENPYICNKNLLPLQKKKMDNIINSSNYVNGLYIKDGRLINDRMPGESGIAQGARMRKAVHNDRKVNMIAEGIELAENKKNFRQLEY